MIRCVISAPAHQETLRLTGYSLSAYLFLSSYSSAQETVPYNDLKEKIIHSRQKYLTDYRSADSASKILLVGCARNYLHHVIINEIFPAWFGTPWDFYGTSRVPRRGKIACGYFVTGVLADAGLIIPRVHWAQQFAEYYIKRSSRDIKRFHNAPVEEVIAYLKNRSDGLYIAGLDNHVGFVYKYNNDIRFVHSSYYHQHIGVMSEMLDSDNPLKHSGYVVLGKIFDDEMIVDWIFKKGIK